MENKQELKKSSKLSNNSTILKGAPYPIIRHVCNTSSFV